MIDLNTAPTPNGWKASVTLEELEVPYEVYVVNLYRYRAEKAGRLLPADRNGRARVIQRRSRWVASDPVMGQVNVFFRYFTEKIQPAIDRYQNECQR